MPSPPEDSTTDGGDRAVDPSSESTAKDRQPAEVAPQNMDTEVATHLPRSGLGAVSGATVVLTGRIAGLAISFGSLAVLARLLTPADYGLLAMILSVTAFLAVFSDLGLTLVTVQRRTISQEQLSTLFWVNAAFGLFLALIAVALAPALVWFFKDDRLLFATIALACVFPIASLGVQHQALLTRRMMLHRLALVRVVGQAVGALTAVAAAFGGLGYWALVFHQIAATMGETLASWALTRWSPGRPRLCDDLRSLLRFGGQLTAHGMLGYFANRLDKVLLGRFAGASSLGLYSVAFNLMTKPIALAGGSVADAAIPALSRCAHDPEVMRTTYRRLLELTCLWGLPACTAGVIWAEDVVLTLLGPKWIEAVPIVSVLCIAAIPRLILLSTKWVYIAAGRAGQMLRWQMAWVPFVVLTFVVGLPFGPLGVAWALALASWIALVPGLVYCFRGTAFGLRDVWRPALAPAICSFVACFAGVYGPAAVFPDAAPGAARLAGRLGVGVIVYAGTAWFFVPIANEGTRRVLTRLRKLVAQPRRTA